MFDWLKEKATKIFESVKVNFTKAKGFIGKAVKEISKKVIESDFISLAKFGVLAGCTIGTFILIYKLIKSKIDSYKNAENTENMDPVDKMMHENNYRDNREQKNLHRKMNRVRDILTKDARRVKAGTDYFWLKKFLYEEEHPGKLMGSRAEWEEFFDDAWFKFGKRDVDDNYAFMQLDEFFDLYRDFDLDGSREGDENILRKTWENTNISHHADFL